MELDGIIFRDYENATWNAMTLDHFITGTGKTAGGALKTLRTKAIREICYDLSTEQTPLERIAPAPPEYHNIENKQVYTFVLRIPLETIHDTSLPEI